MDDFGPLLRHWRTVRRLSQLDLSLAANVSSKHVSFLETGRARPSREMIGLLSVTLDIPLGDRNLLLQAAGYKECFSCMDIDLPEMEPVRRALNYSLNNHNPYPALVMDQEWNMLMCNEGYQRLFTHITSLRPNMPVTQNILEIFFDPNGLRPLVKNWEDVASLFLQRLHRERILYQNTKSDLLERLLAYPNIPSAWREVDLSRSAYPMACVTLQLGPGEIEIFSSLSMFGTAIDATMQRLIIEQYFPVDAESARILREI